MFYSFFLKFSSTAVKISLLNDLLSTCLQFHPFQGFPWKFLISKYPKFNVVWQLVRQLVHSLFDDDYLVPFHLQWREMVLIHEEVYKQFAQDCKTDIDKQFFQRCFTWESNSWCLTWSVVLLQLFHVNK